MWLVIGHGNAGEPNVVNVNGLINDLPNVANINARYINDLPND